MRFSRMMIAFVLAAVAFAQSDRGTITGTVSRSDQRRRAWRERRRETLADGAAVSNNHDYYRQLYVSLTAGRGV